MFLKLLPPTVEHCARFVQHYGLLKALHEAGPFLKEMVFQRDARLERAERFDERFGTDTGGEYWPWQLDSLAGDKSAADAHYYQALSERAIEQAIQHVEGPLADRTFIDFGAGKGRAVLVAARQPFLGCIGVELSSELHATSLDNARIFRSRDHARTTIDFRHGDALQFQFPETPLVVFMYNPFGGETLAGVLANLEVSLAASPRPVTLLYCNPRHGDVVRAMPWLRTLVDRSDLLVAVA